MMHQRQSKRKAGAAVILTAMNNNQFLACQKNKLNTKLRKKATEKLTMHQKMLIFRMIIKKAATTSPTALGGKDTADLITLLCYHASLDFHDLFFHSGLKKYTASGTLEPKTGCRCKRRFPACFVMMNFKL